MASLVSPAKNIVRSRFSVLHSVKGVPQSSDYAYQRDNKDEWSIYGAYMGAFGDFSYNVGLVRYYYPGEFNNPDPSQTHNPLIQKPQRRISPRLETPHTEVQPSCFTEFSWLGRHVKRDTIAWKLLP